MKGFPKDLKNAEPTEGMGQLTENTQLLSGQADESTPAENEKNRTIPHKTAKQNLGAGEKGGRNTHGF